MRSKLSVIFLCLFVLGIYPFIQAQTNQEQADQVQTDQEQDEAKKLDEYRDKFLAKINELRASVKSPPLERWRDGESCADKQSKVDYEKQTTDGPHYSVRHNDWCGGVPYNQNTFPNGWTLEAVLNQGLQNMWDEPRQYGHRDTMENPTYTKVATGFYKAPDGTYWIDMNFK